MAKKHKRIMTFQHREMGARLAAARDAANLSQAYVGQQLNESQTWVSKIETGRRRLDIVELRRMVLLYNTDANSIVMPPYQSVEASQAEPVRPVRPVKAVKPRSGLKILPWTANKAAESLDSGARSGRTRRVRYRVPVAKKRTGRPAAATGTKRARRPRKKR